MSRDPAQPPLVVHGTEIVPSDTRHQYREKIARVTLDSMVQFVGLLDAEGTVVEIFERFRQGDGGINRTVAGTGLGLAIAKEFVEMHKGRIDVLDSDLGGARFEITLPLNRVGAGVQVPDAAAGLDHTVLDGVLEELRFAGLKPKAADPVPVPATAGRPRVLVVEDNPDMNRFVVECLSRDCDVATAFDGREGLEQALRFNPMIVVSDIMMPHVSGVEMVAQMRARPELRQTPILLLSAASQHGLSVAKQWNARQKSREERSPEGPPDWDTSTSTPLRPQGVTRQSSHRAPPPELQ
jgi:CheY-like chemotaxis protein